MVLKTMSEVAPLLAQRYDGPISQREGPGGRSFSYIPWTVTARQLDEVFGPFGWSTSVPTVIFAAGVYTVAGTLTVRVVDDESGEIIEKTVPGVGSAVARGEGDDNASKSALSDFISRAAKLLGDRFGFFLYEKGTATGPVTRPMANAAPTNASGDLGRRPSEKQAAILEKNGIAYEGVPYEVWHSALDAHFEKMKARTASAASW
jgi:recombination DNA repair RAD52 pathway protein